MLYEHVPTPTMILCCSQSCLSCYSVTATGSCINASLILMSSPSFSYRKVRRRGPIVFLQVCYISHSSRVAVIKVKFDLIFEPKVGGTCVSTLSQAYSTHIVNLTIPRSRLHSCI